MTTLTAHIPQEQLDAAAQVRTRLDAGESFGRACEAERVACEAVAPFLGLPLDGNRQPIVTPRPAPKVGGAAHYKRKAILAAATEPTAFDARDPRMAVQLDKVAQEIRDRQAAEAREDVARAALAVPAAQRVRFPFEVQATGKGMAARRQRMIDRLYQRDQLGSVREVAFERYDTARRLTDLYDAAQRMGATCARYSDMPAVNAQDAGDNPGMRARAALATLEHEAGDHWPILERVVCRDQAIGKGGRDERRTESLLDALDWLGKNKGLLAY